jgi:diadenosine tetraphosphate (Ap4A) HIT family hydrolase
MPSFPKPGKDSLIHEDARLFVCLASHPFSKHHVIVVWKKNVDDLHKLSRGEYDHLMHVVDVTRDAMLSCFKTKKVYLIYMDEYRHVHWHLLPRYVKTGFGIVVHKGHLAPDFSVAPKLRTHFARAMKKFGRREK